uniref:Uncharacterized protein n=1 Tax=Anguilla anguilla TaxID=7936 RepID=A0A0E9UEK0_ANGAN
MLRLWVLLDWSNLN